MEKISNQTGILQSFLRWSRQTSGAIALYMALMLPVLTSVMGMGIDVAETYMVHERLARALDAAALAAAGSQGLTEAQMQARVDAFMKVNYPPQRIGTYANIKLTKSGDYITVSGTASYETAFMRAVGFPTLGMKATTTVQMEFKGIEVALVLDNTGSMTYKPTPPKGQTAVANIESLRTAASSFVTTMFSKASKPEDIRIGLVPYANSVRIGLYGLGMTPNPVTGVSEGAYNGGATFITPPPGQTVGNYKNFYAGASGTTKGGTALAPTYSFSSSKSDLGSSSKWYGCVIEHRTGGWDINSSNNDPYPNDIRDDYTGPWETYRFSTFSSTCTVWHCTDNKYNSNGTCKNSSKMVCDTTVNAANITSAPNTSCPYANVMPLTSDKSRLMDAINTMQANGNTQGNTGMIWGYRLISPEAPFTEASEWNSPDWKKAVIMMTDGDNTWDSDYSEYWLSQRSTSMSEATLDSRFKDVCNALRDRDVLVYTIIFKSQTDPTQATKNMYQNCATNAGMYFYAPTQTDLQNVFAQIAHELSNLHISQ